MPGSLHGKVALVTGAAGGIGRVLVQALVAEGAQVAALDVNQAGLTVLQKTLADVGETRLATMAADISDYTQCEAAVRASIARLGGLHILINNAALGMGAIRLDHQNIPVGIEEIEPDMWRRFTATNISGAWNMTRASIAHLRAQGWGRIINITTSFVTMLRGGFQPYGPCKAALEAMSAGHAQEFEGSGVTVNVIAPGGPVDTPMVPNESDFDRSGLIQPGVMAPPVVWLCSQAADKTTGNRYVAAYWNSGEPPAEAERRCRAPIGWPGLGQPMLSPKS